MAAVSGEKGGCWNMKARWLMVFRHYSEACFVERELLSIASYNFLLKELITWHLKRFG
jgi:hypothetical protein